MTFNAVMIGWALLSSLSVLVTELFISTRAQSLPEVETQYGVVRGQPVALTSGAIINSYLGVPYARPPVGDLRFQSPQEPDPWDLPFEAFEPGNACVQVSFGQVTRTHNGWSRFSEDCLYLNVYAPQNAENLPVLVYIHGGAYQEGTSFGHPGYFLAEQDVVAVTIAYRLGVLGYAYTGDDVIPGNAALFDQLMALTFIQENIAAFGGDPSKVTISGESAGGASVGLLMMSPLAAGLFHGSILQSGNELSPWTMVFPDMEPEKFLQEVAGKLGCPESPSDAMADCLRTIDATELMNTTFQCTPGYYCEGFEPVMDGIFIPDRPINLIRSGDYNQVPEMIGLTEDDMNFYTIQYLPWLDEEGLNRTLYDLVLQDLAEIFSPQFPDRDTEDLVQAYRFFYADWPYFEDPERNRYMLGKMSTDQSFGYSSDLQAKLHSRNGNDAFFYIFDYKMSNSPDPEWMGTVHVDDLYPQFGWPFMSDNTEAYNHAQANPSFNITDYSEMDRQFTSFFITLWTNFAKFGNPTPEPVTGPDGSSVLWLPLTEDNLNYITLQAESEVQQNYRQKEYAFWTEYLNYLINGVEF